MEKLHYTVFINIVKNMVISLILLVVFANADKTFIMTHTYGEGFEQTSKLEY